MSDKFKVKKTSCMQNTHFSGIRVSKHSQRNYCPILSFTFYFVAIGSYYVLSHHPTVSYIRFWIIRGSLFDVINAIRLATSSRMTPFLSVRTKGLGMILYAEKEVSIKRTRLEQRKLGMPFKRRR